MEGVEVIFFCNVIGNLILKIIWMKDGEIVGQGDIFNFEISRNQFGKYLCLVENGFNLIVNFIVNFDV